MSRSLASALAILFLVTLAAAGAQEPNNPVAIETAYFAAHDGYAPVRNLSFLWLRVAGVIWVTVEWIAAVYLIRGFALLKRRLDTETVYR